MIHNQYLTLMYLLIFHSHLQNTQNQRQHTALFIYTFSFFFFTPFFYIHGSINSCYTYKQSATVSTAQYNDKGDKFFVTLIKLQRNLIDKSLKTWGCFREYTQMFVSVLCHHQANTQHFSRQGQYVVMSSNSQ